MPPAPEVPRRRRTRGWWGSHVPRTPTGSCPKNPPDAFVGGSGPRSGVSGTWHNLRVPPGRTHTFPYPHTSWLFPAAIHRVGPCQSTQSRPSATSDPSLPVHVHIQPRALTAGTRGRRLPGVRICADRRLLQVFVPQGTAPRLVQQEPVCAPSGAGSRAQPSGAHGAVSHTRLGQCPQNTLRCRTWGRGARRTWGHRARRTWGCNAH